MDEGTNSATQPDPPSTLETSAGSIHQSPQTPLLPPVLAHVSPDRFNDWETISEPDFYDELDFLSPINLTNEKLKNREEEDVIIFDYSLSHPDWNLPIEEGGPSSGESNADGDVFFQVSKDRLIESEQFIKTINPAKEPPPKQSRWPRLVIIDFPQCYDTYDDGLVNSIGERLGLRRDGETAFMDGYSQRVRKMPGYGRFRTGISLRTSFKDPSGLRRSDSSDDRLLLLVSFPYFGGSREIALGPESESVKLLDFKGLGADVSHRGPRVREERDEIAKILVHQARYIIFDNYTMATFRSKEDPAKDQVPLHPFQERISAFRAMIHMVANRMDSESLILGKLQASLCKIEENIDQAMSGGKPYQNSEEMEGAPHHEPQQLGFQRRLTGAVVEKLNSSGSFKRARQKKVQESKERAARDLLISLNCLSASLFAATSVAERQICILQDLHKMFLVGCSAEPNHEKRYPLQKNLFYKGVSRIPILSEYPEQGWPNFLDTIDQMVRERKSFIRKIKELVENMDNRREILFGFLRSTAEGRTKSASAYEIQTPIFLLLTTAFLPLNFCTSFFGMNIKEFDEHPTLNDFYQFTLPLYFAILLLPIMGAGIERLLDRQARKRADDVESQL